MVAEWEDFGDGLGFVLPRNDGAQVRQWGMWGDPIKEVTSRWDQKDTIIGVLSSVLRLFFVSRGPIHPVTHEWITSCLSPVPHGVCQRTRIPGGKARPREHLYASDETSAFINSMKGVPSAFVWENKIEPNTPHCTWMLCCEF